MSGENTFGSTDYWFHRQYVWRIAVQLLQSGGDNLSYLAGDCELRRSLGDSTQLFFPPYKPRHQYLWWRGSRPLNYEPTVIDDDDLTNALYNQTLLPTLLLCLSCDQARFYWTAAFLSLNFCAVIIYHFIIVIIVYVVISMANCVCFLTQPNEI